MAQQFPCPSCGRVIESEVVPGQPVRCPFCEAVVTVPGPGAPPVMPGPVPAAGFSGMPRQTGLATGALVCGIIGVFGCFPLAIVAVVLGIVALTRTSGQPTVYGGRGRAIAGICTGGLGLVVMPMMIAILLPSLSRARELSKRLVCGANLKGLGTSMLIYINEYDAVPDDMFQTFVDMGDITPKQLICPSSGKTLADVQADPYACYVLVPGMAQALAAGVRDRRLVVAYERDNHGGEGGNVLYADGHAEFVRPYSKVAQEVQDTQQCLPEALARVRTR
jgi:prepilin-type processing-associated H-X9-DG protein